MNPLLSEWLGDLTRKALTLLSAFLVSHGLLTESLSGRLMEAAVPLVIAIVWGLYQTYRSRLVLVTALANAPMSEANAVKLVKNSNIENPSVATPKNEVPLPG